MVHGMHPSQLRSGQAYCALQDCRYAKISVVRPLLFVDASGDWKAKVVTEVAPFKEFYRVEEYHQKYLVKYPQGYTCHYARRLKLGE